MSYDITIRSDDGYSQFARVRALAEFIATVPDVQASGESFMFDDRASRYMEIDFEVVSADGDNVEEYGKEYPEINAVRLHIPYPMLGDAPERDYFPTAFAIAKYLGWRVFDDQRDEYRAPDAQNRAVPFRGWDSIRG